LGGKFALVAEDRSVLKSGTQARAERRALLSAALIGSGVGLGLGATYLGAGMAGHAAEHARAEQMAQAVVNGYASAYLATQGEGLRTGLERYSLQPVPIPASATPQPAAVRQAAAKPRRRGELECLADAIYYEARGESPRGQAAVAQVVMNRVRHPAFPDTVCGVVFQGAGRPGCQFSFTCDGSMRRVREAAAWNRARKVAARVLAGAVLADIGSATHFHTTAVAPTWGPRMLRVSVVGAHAFYKVAPRRAPSAGAPTPPAAPSPKAVLISAPALKVPELRLVPAVLDKAVEASAQPHAPQPVEIKAKPAAAPAAEKSARTTEAAALARPPPSAAAVS
jgi:spore germination cell wall hydrolase CwlJ-like protein